MEMIIFVCLWLSFGMIVYRVFIEVCVLYDCVFDVELMLSKCLTLLSSLLTVLILK